MALDSCDIGLVLRDNWIGAGFHYRLLFLAPGNELWFVVPINTNVIHPFRVQLDSMVPSTFESRGGNSALAWGIVVSNIRASSVVLCIDSCPPVQEAINFDDYTFARGLRGLRSVEFSVAMNLARASEKSTRFGRRNEGKEGQRKGDNLNYRFLLDFDGLITEG